ncbi:Tash protein PEST motif family protein [Burkholderia lata]|uniref:Tash protein PEST motif family protein n=1 Tax=Burkholderia lata (strain ATCC 17760 / DSM 23089 / LMG 22485 / NCIMB 9086 / R18194 / 383) TaxID=482957 RepID=A0A6P2GNP6_BURL3|nr:Tash protein PEST motif family protein [Burkholderia lata]
MIASVLDDVTWPAATLVICRSLFGLPTLTVPTGAVPANPLNVTPPTVALLVAVAVPVCEPAPSATELLLPAEAPLPMAMALLALATAPVPMATASVPVAVLSAPVEFAWKYLMPWLLMLLIAEPTLLAVDVVPFAL